MIFQECKSADGNDLRQRHCGDINRRKRCSSSISSFSSQNEMDRESMAGFQNSYHHQYNRSIPTPSTIEAVSTMGHQVGNRRRYRSHRPPLSIRSSYTHDKFLLIILLLLDYITLSKQQGITFGGVLNLDRCYNAMQNSQIDNRISRSQYVTFIQELANNQFQSFRYDSETNTYGNFPTTDFNSFPEQIRQEFNKFACGGINFICDEAYLYTDGTAPGDPVPDPQQEVYLYQVCEGVESTIEDTVPRTLTPTNSPTGAVVKGAVLLNYQITVPSFITEGGLMNGGNDESVELKEALLVTMQNWAQNAVNKLTETGPTSRKLQKQKYERVLAITLDPNEIEFTNVASAVCNVEPLQFRDKCLDIQMVVPLELTGEHSLTPEEIKATLQAKFEESLKDGSFYASLPPEVLEYISAITPPKASTEIPSPPPTTLQPPISPIPPTEAFNPQIPGAKAPIPAPSPDGGGNSSIIGIAAGVSVGLVLVIAGFFVFRRRQAQKRRHDNTDSTPSFGKRRTTDSGNYRGFFSAFTPKKKDIQDDDLEWGHDDSSDDSGSMESYSSHSSSGSDSSSYYSTSDGTSGTGGPASVSASSASSYDTHTEENVPPVYSSMTSRRSSSSSERDLTSRPKLYDFNDSEGSRSDPLSSGGSSKNTTGRERTDSEADDSSAGSSGWESSDGDSSVHSDSVESFDPNTETLGTSISTSQDGAYLDEEMQDRELQPESLNPALNPVVQRGVTMVPVSEENEEDEESSNSSDDSDSRLKIRDDTAPLSKDLDKAIEAGDWAAVGETAAILASDSDRDDESAMKSSTSNSASNYSSGVSASTGYSGETDDSGIVAAHAAEIDHLVESGNWDGVVAVAARYADDASMTSAARRPPKDDDHSDASASLDSASIMTGTTRGSGESKGSVLLSRVGSNSLISNEGSSKGSSGNTPDDDMGTHASSITSSYVSRSGITTSMVSNASSLSDEKQQMNMYRAEVEALVRRVVPDEIDNIDDIMVQFSGREEELIETLKAMQEKSIAQRARAAVQRTAKREKGVLGRSATDESSEDNSESHGPSVDNRTMSSNESSKSSNYSSEYTSSGGGDSITSDFAGLSHSRSSYSNSVGSSYSSPEGTSHSGDSGYSTHSSGQNDDNSYVTGDHNNNNDDDATSSLSAAVDASDWRAMGTPAEMLGEKSRSSGNKDPLEDLLRGGPSEADRASGKF